MRKPVFYKIILVFICLSTIFFFYTLQDSKQHLLVLIKTFFNNKFSVGTNLVYGQPLCIEAVKIGEEILPSFEYFTTGIAISGNYAYLSLSSRNISVIDISNPNTPRRIGGLPYNPEDGDFTSIAVSGNYVYTIAYYTREGGTPGTPQPSKLIVADVSNPSSPRRVSEVFLGQSPLDTSARAIAISGRYVYIVTDENIGKLFVFDVSNPSSPRKIGEAVLTSNEGRMFSIAVSGNYAYIVTYSTFPAKLIVVDISTPSSPRRIADLSLESDETLGASISVSGRYAYVLTRKKLVVVDISNPNAPRRISAVTISSDSGAYGTHALYVSGNYAYLVTDVDPAKLVIVDISNPNSPTKVTEVSINERRANAIAGSGRYIYIGTFASPTKFLVFTTSTRVCPGEEIGEDFPVKWAWIGADCTNEIDCGERTPPLGWISFDSSNTNIANCASYKVRVNYDTGEIMGAGFIGVGEHQDNNLNCNQNSVGWLFFDSNETPPCGNSGYPSDYCFPAKLERIADGWEIRGWAPIISKDAQGNSKILTWVRFKGSNYVVKINNDKTINTDQDKHYAWSGFNRDGGLGWIKFLPTSTLPSLNCSLNAQPSSGSAPLQVNFNLNIQGCSGTSTVSWNGPCTLNNGSCNYTYQNPGNYGPYTATVNCYNGNSTQCSSPTITVSSSTVNFDVAVTRLDIRSFICKNNTPDISYISDYLSRNPNYQYPPSTTAATDYMNVNQIEGKTILQCPETQRNRPVEFFAQGECRRGNCPVAKLRIYVKPENSSADPYETFETSSSPNSTYPKQLTGEYIFRNAYNYEVSACIVDNNNNVLSDDNPSDNCLRKSLFVYHYYCRLGFCTQAQRDWTNPPLYEIILNTLGKTDAPCRFWLNQTCRARFGI